MGHTDICIVGGGLVGLSAALVLSQHGFSIQLIEARPLENTELNDKSSSLDVRSLALSHASEQIFNAIGLWEKLQPLAAPIKQIQVSSAGRFGVTRLHAKKINLDAMGYVIEYHQLQEQLLAAVKARRNVTILAPACVDDIDTGQSGLKITFTMDGKSRDLTTDLMVVAEGASADIREKLGISVETTDYHQVALAANIQTDVPFSGIAYERFTPEGPMAMLPLTESRYALVWTQTAEAAEDLMQLSDQAFLRQLQQKFGYRLGVLKAVGQRASFPLRLSRVRPLVTANSVMIGNAANTLHPVAGQGFNLAMRDIAVLYDQLNGVDLKSDQLLVQLESYQQQRVTDQQQTVLAGHGLVKLFSNDWPLLNHVRSAALAALDLAPLLKREVSWRGMGFGHGLSSLMRGRL